MLEAMYLIARPIQSLASLNSLLLPLPWGDETETHCRGFSKWVRCSETHEIIIGVWQTTQSGKMAHHRLHMESQSKSLNRKENMSVILLLTAPRGKSKTEVTKSSASILYLVSEINIHLKTSGTTVFDVTYTF